MSVEQRLLVTFWAAVAHLLCVTTRSPRDIDRAATHLAGFTKGPFETMKEVCNVAWVVLAEGGGGHTYKDKYYNLGFLQFSYSHNSCEQAFYMQR